MTKPEILKIIGVSGLPENVKRYCANIAGSGLRSSLKTALKENAAAVIMNLDSLLAAAGVILGCSKEDILFATGFSSRNASPERFGAALAEVRAAVFLHAGGFRNLKLIGQTAKKTADICGTRGGEKYVFEVCCIQTTGDLTSVEYLSDKSGARRRYGKSPVDYLELKYDKKVRQVNCSRKEYGCARGGLIFVVEPYGLSASAGNPALEKLARELYARKNDPAGLHICILSGLTACVFPEW